MQVTTPHGPKWLVDVVGHLDSADGESVSPQGVPYGTAPAPAREVELLQAHVDDLHRQLEDHTGRWGSCTPCSPKPTNDSSRMIS